MVSCNVIIKRSTMVKPAKETTPKRTLGLSSLDMIPYMPFNHTCCLYVYPHNTSLTNTVSQNFFDPEILKESFAKVLVYFYPMAGRLKSSWEVENNGGRREIDCNDEGALFIEAEIKTHSLADFGDFKPSPELKKLLFPSCDFSKGLSSFPLVMVQLTRFSCGGVTLGFAANHHAGDGFAYTYMTNSWSRLARGLELEFTPVHERTTYLSPRDPPKVEFQHLEYDPPKQLPLGDSEFSTKTPTQSVFKFTKAQVNALKQKATSSEGARTNNLSTYEALAGHIWRTVCKSRDLDDEQEIRLSIPTDGRFRLKNPALPQGYCGNVVFFPACIAKAGEITGNPLWYASHKIHETLENFKSEEYLRSSIDYLETHPNIKSLVRGPHTVNCPNMVINSWGKLPIYEADFGWGKPAYVGNGGLSREGQCYITSNPDDYGGFVLSISLLAPHMILFQKYLYDF